MKREGDEVAGLAHELRNHFSVIQNLCFLLRRALKANGPVERYLDLLDREVTLARKLAEEVLLLRKEPSVRPVLLNVSQCVRDALEGLVPNEARTTVTFEGEEVEGMVDPAILSRILRNLVFNALEAMAFGPGEIEVRVRASKEDVVIEVADRGPGIPQGDLERIFEPFVSKKAGGTGLGLALVKRWVEAMGGVIEAKNREGGGALFIVTLKDALRSAK